MRSRNRDVAKFSLNMLVKSNNKQLCLFLNQVVKNPETPTRDVALTHVPNRVIHRQSEWG